MPPADRVLRSVLWTDSRFSTLAPVARLAWVWLICHADLDGIAPADEASLAAGLFPSGVSVTQMETARSALGQLAACGLCTPYVAEDGTSWAWVPNLAKHQPSTGPLRPVRDHARPAPTPAVVRRTLAVRLQREPTLPEQRAACPRAFGRTRKPGVASPDADEALVFAAWRSRQPQPEVLTLTPAARTTIREALREAGTAGAAGLVALVEYVYEADEQGPRFLRDKGFLGLDTLMRRDRVQSRIQAALAWRSRQDEDGPPPPSPVGQPLSTPREPHAPRGADGVAAQLGSGWWRR